MKTFYLTDPGKVRSHNEDAVMIEKNNNNEEITLYLITIPYIQNIQIYLH